MTARFLARVCAMLGLWLALAVPVSTSGKETEARRFFVSASTGNDGWSGRDARHPWKSLERVRRASFRPGDEILLKAGDRFAGQLELRSSGAPGSPLRVGRYGEGARPVIDGAAGAGGAFAAAILIRNRHNIEIRGLEIVDAVESLRPGEAADTAAGILVINDGGGELANFVFEDLYIHDVFARAIAHATEDEFNRVSVSGIRFTVADQKAKAPPSFFRNVRIVGNLISRTGRFGVQMGHPGAAGAQQADAHTRDSWRDFNRDIVIARNRFVELGGSGVQLGGARMALIEDNDFDRCGSSVVPERMVGRGSGAWVINSRDVVAQRNRSRHIRGYKDSYGMHVDFGNLNVLFQYNYSEDSEGGFVEILGNNRNVTWRYNVSVNDGLREKEGNTIWFSTWSPRRTRSQGISIHNNTVYVRPGLTPDISLTARDARIWNNLFYVAEGSEIGRETTIAMPPEGLRLDRNLFYGSVSPRFTGIDPAAVTADPLLSEPGALTPAGYRLRAGSPAIGAGVALEALPFPEAGKGVFEGVSAVATVDYFGNPLAAGGRPNIGADGARP